jgi:hypothetical protein
MFMRVNVLMPILCLGLVHCRTTSHSQAQIDANAKVLSSSGDTKSLPSQEFKDTQGKFFGQFAEEITYSKQGKINIIKAPLECVNVDNDSDNFSVKFNLINDPRYRSTFNYMTKRLINKKTIDVPCGTINATLTCAYEDGNPTNIVDVYLDWDGGPRRTRQYNLVEQIMFDLESSSFIIQVASKNARTDWEYNVNRSHSVASQLGTPRVEKYYICK